MYTATLIVNGVRVTAYGKTPKELATSIERVRTHAKNQAELATQAEQDSSLAESG